MSDKFIGININKIKKPDLRRSLGIVLQDVNLFTGTIMDNIRYGNLNATDEECIKASKLSNAVITYFPVCQVIKTIDQICNRCFPCTGGSDKSYFLSGSSI